MCGRFHNHLRDMHRWVSLLKDWPSDHSTSYNVAPTQSVPIVTPHGTHASRWGLIPSWAKEFKSQYATFNARIETVANAASFKNAWRKSQTCLVPMFGYYEWIKQGKEKQPYLVQHEEDIMVLAGLWETWQDQSSFTIITGEAKGTLANLHTRMPFMLTPETAEAWLECADRDILNTATHYENVRYFPVSKKVNNARNEGPELAEEIPVHD